MRAIALLTLFAFVSSSCVTTSINVGDLSKLDGYRDDVPGQNSRMLDVWPTKYVKGKGLEQVEFKPGRRLTFTLLGERAVTAEFSRITVAANTLSAVTGNRTLSFDLGRITGAQVSWLSPARSVGAVFAVIGAAAVPERPSSLAGSPSVLCCS
jgi:hypothetical protein